MLYLFIVCMVWTATVDASREEALADVIVSYQRFTNLFFREVAKASSKFNILFSPVVIHASLSLVAYESQGKTAKQMTKALSLPIYQRDLLRGYSDFFKILDDEENLENLQMSNGIFISDKIKVKENFASDIADIFDTTVKIIDYQSKNARSKVNNYVSKVTYDKISEVIRFLEPDVKALVISTMYFAGTWKYPFDTKLTTMKPFHITPEKSVQVPMMHTLGYFQTYQSDKIGALVLNLPYKFTSLSFVIVFPLKADGLKEVEKHIGTIQLSSLIKSDIQVPLEKCDIYLPKFDLVKKMTLNDLLEDLGITDLFLPSANLSGITDDAVYINGILHGVGIKINENGGEDDSKDENDVTVKRNYEVPKYVIDRPFVFFVWSRKLFAPLFVGRYSYPD